MYTKNIKLSNWVLEMAKLCNPDKVAWIDGSDKQKKELEREAMATGEIMELDQELLPGCLYHRTALNDVARTEN